MKGIAAEWVAINAHKRDAGREWPYYSGKNHRINASGYMKYDPDSFDLKIGEKFRLED